jgi:hypothetical protein
MEQIMKIIKINRIEIANFKGISYFHEIMDKKNIIIKGNNGAGKTSIFDSFIWLFFNKDSQWKTDCQLINIHNQDKEMFVEFELAVDNEPILFKKSMLNKEINYYINGTNFRKKNYEIRVNEIISLNNFKLLCDPLFFNGLHWTKRREILFKLCKDVSVDDIVKVDNSFKQLEGLTYKMIDDILLNNKQKQRRLKTHLSEYPIRIDEANFLGEELDLLHEDSGTYIIIDRIKNLKEEEESIVFNIGKAEKLIDLITRFYSKKAELLEYAINNHFYSVSFQTFKKLENESFQECCNTMVEGVDFNNGLNTGSKINAGIEIINVLSKHFGVTVPMFVDNKESITDLIETKSQVIGLVVDKDCDKLNVE